MGTLYFTHSTCMNDELDFSEDIIEVQILKRTIEIFQTVPDNTNKKDSYILAIIRDQCKDLNDNGLTHRRICKMLPKQFYSLSFKIDQAKTIDYIKSAIKLLNWKY
jgi:hypothetical protein